MKRILIAVVMLGLGGGAYAADFSGLQRYGAGDMAGMEERSSVPVSGPAEVSLSKNLLTHKIHVTPVTEHWKDTMLVKFRREADVNIVRSIMAEAGVSSWDWADNGSGILARVDIIDTQAPRKARLFAGRAIVEAVEVNRNVFNMLDDLKSNKAAAPAPKSSLKEINGILSSSPLPGGCKLEVNAFNSSYFAENLNVGISKAGVVADLLMSGDVPVSFAGGVYRYEAVSTEGSGMLWQDHRVKDVFELRVDGGNNIVSVAIEKYKESKSLLGELKWKRSGSVMCSD